MKVSLKNLVMTALTCSLMGCTSLNFYTQAVTGQVQLLLDRQPIDIVLAEPTVSQEVKNKLLLSRDVLKFAEEELGLPVEDSYSSYVDTGKRFVVWNVFAAEEFSAELQTFCYPIAGCVSYRGFFKEGAAQAFASKLRQQGYEIFVGGVAAYSTLGWFDDPLLNTFMVRTDEKLAALLFHELAHKVMYVPGDTRFNESFATAVERIALSRWLAARGQPDAFDLHLAAEERSRAVIKLIAVTRNQLAEIYRGEDPDKVKRERKEIAIAKLQSNYKSLKANWHDPETTFPEFEFWMQGEINNARLGTVADYNDLVPLFEKVYARHGEDLPSFFETCRDLANLTADLRISRLESLATGS